MKQKLPILFIALTAVWALPSASYGQQSFDPQGAQYLWPTEASSYLTSTFAETRSQHFHAALDIKTWGRRGYKVYATRDGIVDRVAIGPRGYGKVVYLKHDDGSSSVYAHLLSFNEQLQQLADSARFADNYRFEIEKFWEWKNIKVQQGEVIGYSGASGIGPPHLHFELRTPSHKPFNPLLTNLSVKDNIAPEIQGIAVEPLSPQSSVEGRNAIYTKRAWLNGENYELGTITAAGPIGLSVDVFDQSNGVNNVYAVYELNLSVNGQSLFTSRVDSFSYHETDQMFLDRIYPFLQNEEGSYQRLYIADGNTLPFYITNDTKGALDLPPGNHEVTIRATDYFGNSSSASINLIVEPLETHSSELSHNTSSRLQVRIPSVHRWSWFGNWLTVPESIYQQLIVGTDQNQLIKHENGISIDLTYHDNLFLKIPELGPINLRSVHPESSNIIASTNQQGFAIFPKNTFYDTVYVGMTTIRRSQETISVDIIPEAYPIRHEYTIYVKRDSSLIDTSKLAFYKFDRFDDDEQWELIPTTFTDEFIRGKAESLGTFTTMRDTTAPVVSTPRVRQRPNGKWVLIINAIDNLSGIDYNRTRISINGIRGIAEFEPEDDQLVYYHPDFTPADSMKIRVTAYDKMGNHKTSNLHLKQ